MPFTPSHAVVALAFRRGVFVPAAVAVGAMAPDLPLFLGGFPLRYVQTHSLLALPATTAVAVVLLLLWRCVLRPATRELAPAWVAARLPGEWDHGAARGLAETLGSISRAAKVVLSAAIGVVTHIVWDLFTHEGRAGTELIPALAEQWGPWQGYRWLQYVSGVCGLLVIGLWMWRWVMRRRPLPFRRVLPTAMRVVWWLSLPVLLLAAWVWGLSLWGPLTEGFTVAHLAYAVLPEACAVFGGLTVVLAVLVQVRRARASRRTQRGDDDGQPRHARDVP